MWKTILSREKIKKLVKTACTDVSFKDLIHEVNSRNLKKIKHIKYDELILQDYLQSKKITTSLKKLIFSARTKMLPVGANYGQETKCFACSLEQDTNQHLLECITLKLSSADLIENTKIVFEDIYSSNIDKVVETAKLIRSALRTREIIKNDEK